MGFKINAYNLPRTAIFWRPVIYVVITPCYPSASLPVGTEWNCPVGAGGGLSVDFRCITYDSTNKLLDKRDKYGVIVRDGAEYAYDWSNDTFYEVAIAEPEFANLTVSFRRG